MDDFIRRRATGTPDEFAKKMDLQKSTLMLYIKEMRTPGAKISYCKERQCYQYDDEGHFRFGFSKLSETDMEKKKGGKNLNFFHDLIILDSPITNLLHV